MLILLSNFYLLHLLLYLLALQFTLHTYVDSLNRNRRPIIDKKLYQIILYLIHIRSKKYINTRFKNNFY